MILSFEILFKYKLIQCHLTNGSRNVFLYLNFTLTVSDIETGDKKELGKINTEEPLLLNVTFVSSYQFLNDISRKKKKKKKKKGGQN